MRPAASSTARSRTSQAMQAYAERSKVGVVIGGGLLGLEAANALQNLGLETHVVELAPRLMSLQVDDIGGAVLRRRIEALGVTVHLGALTTRIATNAAGARRGARARRRHRAAGRHGRLLGRHPPARRARHARRAWTLGERGGIVIDERCRTSRPGDLRHRRVRCLQRSRLRPGRARLRDGARRGSALAGHGGETFAGFDMSTKLKLMGVDVASFGDAFAADARRARDQRRRHAGRSLQEAGRQPRQAAPARRRPGRRRRRLRPARAAGAEPHPAAAPPGRSVDAAARGRASRPASASTRSPTPRRSARATT